MSDPTPREAALADLLAAIREGLNVPHAATVGDEQIRDRILGQRVMHVSAVLAVFDKDPDADRVTICAAYLREQLAEQPAVGYVTVDQARAARTAQADEQGESGDVR